MKVVVTKIQFYDEIIDIPDNVYAKRMIQASQEDIRLLQSIKVKMDLQIKKAQKK